MSKGEVGCIRKKVLAGIGKGSSQRAVPGWFFSTSARHGYACYCRVCVGIYGSTQRRVCSISRRPIPTSFIIPQSGLSWGLAAALTARRITLSHEAAHCSPPSNPLLPCSPANHCSQCCLPMFHHPLHSAHGHVVSDHFPTSTMQASQHHLDVLIVMIHVLLAQVAGHAAALDCPQDMLLPPDVRSP